MKTSLTLLLVAALAAFVVVLLNVAVAASALFGLGLYGLVRGDYAKTRTGGVRLVPVRATSERTERFSLAA